MQQFKTIRIHQGTMNPVSLGNLVHSPKLLNKIKHVSSCFGYYTSNKPGCLFYSSQQHLFFLIFIHTAPIKANSPAASRKSSISKFDSSFQHSLPKNMAMQIYSLSIIQVHFTAKQYVIFCLRLSFWVRSFFSSTRGHYIDCPSTTQLCSGCHLIFFHKPIPFQHII